MAHTFDSDRAAILEDPSRYRYCSGEELVSLITPADRVLDLGSGTGFYTDVVIDHVDQLIALDVQPAMHGRYREKGVPPGVDLVTGQAAAIPLDDDAVAVVYATMTFHEIATRSAMREVRRILAPGGRFVIVDWSALGRGEAGPPIDERRDAAWAADFLREFGFGIDRSEERPETFVLVGTRPR